LGNYRKWKADVNNSNVTRDRAKEICTTCVGVNERLKVNYLKQCERKESSIGGSCSNLARAKKRKNPR
jgi:hypothetical protein